MRNPVRFCVALALFALLCPLLADLDGSYLLPLDDRSIHYASGPVIDSVTRLQQRLEARQAKLTYDAKFGYLPSLLRELTIPVSSQVLVFSKTSFQAPLISPETPRALYFNDHTAVGFVQTGDVLEIAAADREQGVIFYTLQQEATAQPQLKRRDDCLQCHASGGTLGVPGFTIRSVFPDSTGQPFFQAGSFTTDDRSPFHERWGGWFVTGTHGAQRHMGNAFVADPVKPDQLDTRTSTNITSLKGLTDTASYLSPHSDIVALMVLEHQARMENLITRLGFETRMALARQAEMNKLAGDSPDYMGDSTRRIITNIGNHLVRYMLFSEETPLTGEVRGTSTFAADYSAKGPRDHKGRSLRDFDLKQRLFKYPCSPLIYGEAFDHLPSPARAYVYRRLWEVLSGRDQSAEFKRLSPEDRQAIREILLETKQNLPPEWHQ